MLSLDFSVFFSGVSVSELVTVFSGYRYWVGRLKLGEFTLTQMAG